VSQSCKLGATFQSRGWRSLASRELRCRGREVGDAIDCDISQAPSAPGGWRRLRSGKLARIGRRWCHTECSPRSLISSAGFSAVHTDHSSGVAAPSEILPPVLDIHAVLSGLPAASPESGVPWPHPAGREVSPFQLSSGIVPLYIFPDHTSTYRCKHTFAFRISDRTPLDWSRSNLDRNTEFRVVNQLIVLIASRKVIFFDFPAERVLQISFRQLCAFLRVSQCYSFLQQKLRTRGWNDSHVRIVLFLPGNLLWCRIKIVLNKFFLQHRGNDINFLSFVNKLRSSIIFK